MLTHDDANMKKCTICNKYESNRVDSLKRHMETCKVPDLKCQTCDQTFQYPSYLKRHVCSKSKSAEKKSLKVKLPPKRQKQPRPTNSGGACAYPSMPPVVSPSESVPCNLTTLVADAVLIWNAAGLFESDYMHHGLVGAVGAAVGDTCLSYTMVEVAELDSTLLHHVHSSIDTDVDLVIEPIHSPHSLSFGSSSVDPGFLTPVDDERPALVVAQSSGSSSVDPGFLTPVDDERPALVVAQSSGSSSVDPGFLTPVSYANGNCASSSSENTLCQRRRRIAQDFAKKMSAQCADNDVNPTDVMKLVLKYMNISHTFPMVSTYISRTPLAVRLVVWEFWHNESDPSTITTALARLRVAEKPGCQEELEYTSTVRIVVKRNRKFYQSIWRTLSVPIISLYKTYRQENQSCVSIGLFLNLRPFYVRSVSSKDIEMCCCKLHLHARWVVSALMKLAGKLNVPLPVSDYESFFSILYADCGEIDNTYIPWVCTPNKKNVCNEIAGNFSTVVGLMEGADENITVPFTHFEKKTAYNEKGEVIFNKKGKEVQRLVATKEQANSKFLVEFFKNLLPNIIHHRNMLKLFRNLKGMFLELMHCAYIDVDFSENLTLGIKWEPQSMHWCKKQVTIHSAILKFNEEKVYYPTPSNTRVHDQVFVKQILEMVVEDGDLPEGVNLVIESDNCTGQYKSLQHFYHLQNLANTWNRTIYRIYGIAGHGKGEVDHVGGVAKVAVRTAIASGSVFHDSSDITSFLLNKFSDKETPRYHIQEFPVDVLNEERMKDHRKDFSRSVGGSSEFHVAIFTPNAEEFKAAPRLCMCDLCMNEYGTCELFESYPLRVQDLNTPNLRRVEEPQPEVVGEENVNDFILPDSIVAVAAPKKSIDTVWFIQVVEVNRVRDISEIDSYEHQIPPGMVHLTGHFLERDERYSSKKATVFNVSKETTYFYKESILYPFVNVQEDNNKRLSLSVRDYTDILLYIESNGFSHL